MAPWLSGDPGAQTAMRVVDDDGAGAGGVDGNALAGTRCACPPPGMASRAAARATEEALFATVLGSAPTRAAAPALELLLEAGLDGGLGAAGAAGAAEAFAA